MTSDERDDPPATETPLRDYVLTALAIGAGVYYIVVHVLGISLF